MLLRDEASAHALRTKAAIHSDIIHFACHGTFDGENPLSSRIELADKSLSVEEIFNLRFNASLVVLSACDTGLSKILTGDELVGLQRALFYAGTPSIVSSLWAVYDQSTAELMSEFYRHFLRPDSELATKSSALRTAQIGLKEKYEHPYFWAPFVLIGDWQ